MRRHISLLLLAALVMLVGGCNSSNGSITFTLTDAPVDTATSVIVDVTGLKAVSTTGKVFNYTFTSAQQIDLLQLQHGLRTPLVVRWGLPDGDYQFLSLKISADGSGTDSYIVLNDGTQHALVASSSATTGNSSCGNACSVTAGDLPIYSHFTVRSGNDSSYIIDFDARKSILQPAVSSTAYRLQPAGRMTEESDAGNVIGVVSASLITPGCVPAAYVYAGAGKTPTDIDSSASSSSQPLTEAAVTMDNQTGEYHFTAAYLPAGNYTVAFTCQADLDNPDEANTLSFTYTGSLWVSAGLTSKFGLN